MSDDGKHLEINAQYRAWADAVHAKGGHVMPYGSYPYAPNQGEPYAWYPDSTKPLGRRYELAPLAVRSLVKLDKATEAAKGKVYSVVNAVGDAAQKVADDGVFGLLARVLGLSKGTVVALVIAGATVVGYGAFVQAGIAPPVRSLFRKGG